MYTYIISKHVIHTLCENIMLLSSVTNDVKNTLMAEIFAGLYVREFRKCGKLAKIKSRKRSLEYCLEPVTWNVIVTLRLTKSESTQENLWGTRPTRVRSLQQGTCLSCCVVPGGRPAPGRCCRFKYSDKRGIRECNSEIRTYETLLDSFPNEQQRTELEHTAH